MATGGTQAITSEWLESIGFAEDSGDFVLDIDAQWGICWDGSVLSLESKGCPHLLTARTRKDVLDLCRLMGVNTGPAASRIANEP